MYYLELAVDAQPQRDDVLAGQVRSGKEKIFLGSEEAPNRRKSGILELLNVPEAQLVHISGSRRRELEAAAAAVRALEESFSSLF